MKAIGLIVVLAAFLCQPTVAHFKFGEEVCFTFYDTTRVAHVPTQSLVTTVGFTLTVTEKIHPKTTVTPISTVETTTTAIASTTVPQITDTFTSVTETITTYTTVTTSVSTSTVTSTTTTVSTGTVTVSVAPNFTPFASVAAVIAAGGGTPEPGVSKRDGSLAFPRRGLDVLNKRDVQKLCPAAAPPKYPSHVKCYVYVEQLDITTKKVTASYTKTKTASTLETTTTDIVSTTVTTTLPDASTTVPSTATTTTTTTSTAISITTTTTTSTSTLLAATTATYYPQCQSDNLIEYVGGNPLYMLSASNPTFANQPDAVSCCELCANTAGCSGFSGSLSPFTDCYLFPANTCDASVVDWTVYSADGQTSDFDVVGNGNCGQGTFGGPPA